ncbi:MAG: hypothetical protein ACI8RD_011928, partial [Bacillariaceae sp.]|jgi:hypothetical protein
VLLHKNKNKVFVKFSNTVNCNRLHRTQPINAQQSSALLFLFYFGTLKYLKT